MKHFLPILFSISVSFQAIAQFTLLPAPQKNTQPVTHSQLRSAAVAPLNLPFWDDFSTSKGQPDTLLWMPGSDVYVNNSLGRNAPTLNVATLDGLRADGAAHDINATFGGYTDSLVSRPINLLTIPQNLRNTVFLSFFWQAGGNGEQPDETDSLELWFKNVDSLWVRQWVQAGSETTVSDQFAQVLLPVDDPSFYHNAFQFKFVSYGNLSGPFDTWHLDYVYLHRYRSASDLSHFDRALGGQGTALLGNYYAIPSAHFPNFAEKTLREQRITATNLDNTLHPLVYFYQLRNELTGEFYINRLFDSNIGAIDPLAQIEIPGPQAVDLAISEMPDSVVLSSSFFWQTGDTLLFEVFAGFRIYSGFDLKVNDTLRTYYTLHQHYAYDDGSAEFAAALNTTRGQLALRYAISEQDTLTHLDLYFPNIAPASAGKQIDLIVWGNLSRTGERIRQPFTIQAPHAINSFTRVQLGTPLIVRDTIYIGFQQFTDSYIGVGLDRSNPDAGSQVFFNVTGTWEQNTTLQGALMMRPVFGTDTTNILGANPPVMSSVIYPNPAHSPILQIQGNYDEVEIFDLSGQRHFHSLVSPSTIELPGLRPGLYLVRLRMGHTISTEKWWYSP